ncbi:NADPH-dependent FMN reductase [Planktotalea arctica]|uniref:NADPH-dependent FMN reductase n=1 Tax=Planktotalea arctica TaxID=1481893 RepID=UPI0032197A14
MPSRSKILVFAATNSRQSINKRLASHAACVLRDDLSAAVDIDLIDLNDYEMPIYSPEREAEGIPQLAQDFYDKVGASDGLIMSFAEYNGSYTAAFKNIFDWTSRISMKVFQDKPTLLLATSMGGRGGQNVMAAALEGFPHFGANITSSFLFGPFAEHFDTDANRLKTPDLTQELSEAVEAFKATLRVD